MQEVADRAYWEERGSKATLSMADGLLEMVKEWYNELTLKYNKFYIGLAKNGQPNNFVVFRPKKEWLKVELKLERTDELEAELEKEGLDVMGYDTKWGKYRIRLAKGEVKKHEAFLRDLLKQAYDGSS